MASERLRIIGALTSNYKYLLDMKTKDLVGYQSKTANLEFAATPFDNIWSVITKYRTSSINMDFYCSKEKQEKHGIVEIVIRL